MKILVIRHGDPDYSIDSLTEKGFREAEQLSDRLIKMDIDDFYCSPLGRAKATAKPTMDKLGRKCEELYWLREFAGQIISPYSGKMRIPWDLGPSVWADEKKYYDSELWLTTPMMKSGNVAEVFEETKKGIDELLCKYGIVREGMHYKIVKHFDKEPVIALFCHCVMGLTVISQLTNTPPMVLWHNFFMPTSSVSTVITQTDKNGITHFRCASIGDTSHIYAADDVVSESGLNPEFER